MSNDIEVPRNFKLLDELDNVKKYNNISYGLTSNDDNLMHSWNGTIFHNNGDISTLEIYVGDDYPTKPPTVKLLEYNDESNQGCRLARLFNKNRELSSTFNIIKNWSPAFSIGDILQALLLHSTTKR